MRIARAKLHFGHCATASGTQRYVPVRWMSREGTEILSSGLWQNNKKPQGPLAAIHK